MCLRRGRLLTHQYDDAIFRSCVAILRLSVYKTNPKKGNTNSINLSGWQVNIRWCHRRQILSRDEKGASLMDTTRWLNFRLSHVLTFSDKVVKILHTYSCLQKQNVVNMASQRHENQGAIWKKFLISWSDNYIRGHVWPGERCYQWFAPNCHQSDIPIAHTPYEIIGCGGWKCCWWYIANLPSMTCGRAT